MSPPLIQTKMRGGDFLLSPLSKPGAVPEIRDVVIIFIGLTLERNHAIRLVEISRDHYPNQPFQTINEVERQVEQLAHLTGMDRLVTQQPIGDLHPVSYEENSENIDGRKLAERNPAISDNFHLERLEIRATKEAEDRP